MKTNLGCLNFSFANKFRASQKITMKEVHSKVLHENNDNNSTNNKIKSNNNDNNNNDDDNNNNKKQHQNQ